jgi:hypothetical protein
MRYVVIGAAVLPRAPAMWDDGVDGGPGLRREMRRLLEPRVFMRIGQSACGSVGPWDLVGTSEEDERTETESGSRCAAWSRVTSMWVTDSDADGNPKWSAALLKAQCTRINTCDQSSVQDVSKTLRKTQLASDARSVGPSGGE